VGDIENDRPAGFGHDWQPPVIDHEIVVAKGGAPFGKHNLFVSRCGGFGRGKSHVFRREKLPFLDVDGKPRRCCGHDQVSLAAEERGNLEHIDIGCREFDLGGFVNIG